MLSNYFEYVRLSGEGATAQAVLKNYWGIGIVKPFSQEIRYSRAECESMLQHLKTISGTDTDRTRQAFTVAAQRLRDAGA